MAQKHASREAKARKPYEKPAIVYSQKVEARAVVCSRANDTCFPGPLSTG